MEAYSKEAQVLFRPTLAQQHNALNGHNLPASECGRGLDYLLYCTYTDSVFKAWLT